MSLHRIKLHNNSGRWHLRELNCSIIVVDGTEVDFSVVLLVTGDFI